jgi:hypothetical protein
VFDEDNSPSWLIYQRCIAAFVSEEHGSLDTTVLPNVMLQGAISGQQRQVDVLVDHRWQGDATSRIIVDAKERSDPIDIGDVEQFEGMMRDCCAARGIIVCTAGWTSGAQKRAQQAITITILGFKEALENFGWAYEECLGSCRRKTRSTRRGGVLWGEFMAEGLSGLRWGGADEGLSGLRHVTEETFGYPVLAGWTLLQVGKCDTCHDFHVWCWDCGEKFAIGDGEVVTCGCDGREWASVPESAESGHIGTPKSIWLMMREADGPPVPFDRRPIR